MTSRAHRSDDRWSVEAGATLALSACDSGSMTAPSTGRVRRNPQVAASMDRSKLNHVPLGSRAMVSLR